MRVVLYHPKRLPPRDYGGVERVVLWLAKGLLERGHHVSVVAAPGSLLPKGVEFLPGSDGPTRVEDLIQMIPSGTEVLHFMAPPGAGVLESLPWPALVTVHGNGKPGEQFHQNSVFLSADHARRHSATDFVYNGLDPAEYRFNPEPRSSPFLFLSKTSWKVKNLKGAIHYCKKAGVALSVAGGRRPLLERILVALDGKMRWVGPVGGVRKAELLAQSRGLIFPVVWDEPFGLVVIEAMISGMGVLASNRGSLPELISAETGHLLQTEEEWVETLRSYRAKSPDACRQRCLERFHYHQMAESYEKRYRLVQQGQFLNPTLPISQRGERRYDSTLHTT